MNIENLPSWVKLSPKYLVPIAFLSFSLLFLPAKILLVFGVSEFVSQYRIWIGITGLLSAALSLGHFFVWTTGKIGSAINSIFALRNAKKSLRNLTADEKNILCEYVARSTKSRKLDIQSGVVNGLEQASIIYQASQVGNLMEGFDYNIQPWAWQELKMHPELLEPELSQYRAKFGQRRQPR